MLKTPGSAFHHAVEVRFRDLDPLGHVNNSVYLTYFEAARIAYWIDITGNPDIKHLDMILARVEVDFRSPAFYAEVLDISLWCSSIGQTSFVLESRMMERRTQRLVAEARKVLVYYDHSTAKPRPLPPDIRTRLQPAETGGVRRG
jgi:acyl-CoA thioester hydrolase